MSNTDEGLFKLLDFLAVIDGVTAEDATKAIMYTLQWLTQGTYAHRLIDGEWNKQLGFYTEQLFLYADSGHGKQIMHVFKAFVQNPNLRTVYNK